MAQRRMIAKTITHDDNFVKLSSSAQALYLHLMMDADDDGFNNEITIAMFRAHASVQDLQALLELRYIYQFESGVIVIKHWRMANALRKDRYTPTVFQRELAMLRLKENGAYTLKGSGRLPDGCQTVAERLPQVRIGQVRLGEDREGEEGSEIPIYAPESGSPEDDPTDSQEAEVERERISYQEIVDEYNKTCISLPKVVAISEARRKAIKARVKQYGTEKIFDAFRLAERSSFLKGGNKKNWSADFDWLMKDGNIPKVLEGKYDDRTGQQAAGGVRPKGAEELDAAYKMMADWAEEENDEKAN